MPDQELLRQVEQFLYREARLLDDGEFEAWLDLFSDDAHYWMPSRETRDNPADSVKGPEALPLVDDDKAFMKARVDRMRSGFAHAEQPASRTRRFVSNVEVVDESPDNGLEVHSNILVFQSRLEKTEKFFVGKRKDLITAKEGQLLIRQRTVILDHVLLPRSVSIFL